MRRRALARERVTVDLTEIDFPPPRGQSESSPARIVAQVDDLEQMRLALELGLHAK